MLDHFDQLSQVDQLELMFRHGTFVAYRREGDAEVNLYFMGGPGTGFFVELYYSPRQGDIVRVRSFCNIGPLEGYVTGVELPEEWA